MLGDFCFNCPVWIKPSPMAPPGVPAYLVDEVNTTIAALLFTASVVFAIKLASRIRRSVSGQPRFTD